MQMEAHKACPIPIDVSRVCNVEPFSDAVRLKHTKVVLKGCKSTFSFMLCQTSKIYTMMVVWLIIAPPIMRCT